MLSESLKPALKGLLTWVPGLRQAFYDATAGGGTASATYCYGVWLKHFTLLWQHGMRQIPQTVVELGPGASLGTGLAALLSGAERYIAIDAVKHARSSTSRQTLRELATLFAARAPRPRKGWPDFDAFLDENLFPSQILTSERLSRSLAAQRLESLDRDLERLEEPRPRSALRYVTWNEPLPCGDGEADLVFSHVVLCHIQDLDGLYGRCARWLKPGGWMSHQTEFSSLGTTPQWNGHYQYSEPMWKLIAGRRPYFVGREPCSTHLRLLAQHGFDVVNVIRSTRGPGIERSMLAPRWRHLSDEDLACSDAFILARKR